MTPVERNRVRINIDVDEGPAAKIQQIRFVGNKIYDEGDLRDEMQLGTPNWFSWYTKRDQYSRAHCRLRGNSRSVQQQRLPRLQD